MANTISFIFQMKNVRYIVVGNLFKTRGRTDIETLRNMIPEISKINIVFFHFIFSFPLILQFLQKTS